MRKYAAVIALGVVGLLSVAMVVAAKGPAVGQVVPPSQKSSYTMHEWGTFTGFAGSDGVHLAFTQDIGANLPAFVKTRMAHAMDVDPNVAQRLLFLKWNGAAALQRMETPVIYFYADAPKDIDVKVALHDGTLTEFYPPVREMTPKFGWGPGEPGAARIDATTRPADATTRPAADPNLNSSLDWGRIRIIPRPTGDEGKLVPAIPNALDPKTQDHYGFARQTDAALVQTTDVKGSRHEEKFLFYRGLGNFKLPVILSAKGGGTFELNNVNAAPVSTAFLLETQPNGQVRFAKFDKIAGRREMTLPGGYRTQSELAEAIEQALVAEGLYEKEAHAMVATWRANWLAEPGTRVLYTVQRRVTDELLPLQLTPTPDQAVRVLVGRIDVLTPEIEMRLGKMIGSVTADGPAGLSVEDARLVSNLGRFATPAIQRAAELRGASAETATKQTRALWDAVVLRTTVK